MPTFRIIVNTTLLLYEEPNLFKGASKLLNQIYLFLNILYFQRGSPDYEGAALRLGIGAHFMYHEAYYTEELKEFLKLFPEWSYPIDWLASYESRFF